jgi:hypothetical protein
VPGEARFPFAGLEFNTLNTFRQPLAH